MTTHYFDCKIIQTTDAPETVLGKLYNNIHGILASQKITHVGISLPEINKKPGQTIRLFADKETLESIKGNRGINFYQEAGAIIVTDTKPVPAKYKLAVFHRDRFSGKSTGLYALKSELKLLKHLAKKGVKLDEKELAGRRKIILARQKNSLPYILMQSKSTRRTFSLFIKKEIVDSQKAKVMGTFNYYGLSTKENPVALPVF